MKLFNQYEYAKLLENGKPRNHDKDHYPVVKLFTSDRSCICLITEIYDLDHAYGLLDLGNGPMLDYIPISQLLSIRDKSGSTVMCDKSFVARFPISVYSEAARHHDRIIEDEIILEKFVD